MTYSARFLSLIFAQACLSVSLSAQALPNESNSPSAFTKIQGQNTQSSNIQSLGQNTPWVAWGLNEQDWKRYEEVMKGPRGVWTPNLDPLTALTWAAETDFERTRYAELLVQKEHERVVRELAMQRAYDDAFKRLYPDELPFTNEVKTYIDSGIGRIIFFTQMSCEACTASLPRLFDFAGKNQVDIFIMDSEGDDNKIRDWAIKSHIDVKKVKNRQITLNHDKGMWLKYASKLGNGKIPVAFRVSPDGQWTPVKY